MKDNSIPDSSIEASSEDTEHVYPAIDGRLCISSFWGADPSAINPWIQADIGKFILTLILPRYFFNVCYQGGGHYDPLEKSL